MQTRFMGISHGSSPQHVTVWSIFGNGRYPGTEPEAVHSGPGCMPMPIPLHALSLIGSVTFNFDWIFKFEDDVKEQIKCGRSCVSPPLFQRRAQCGISASVSRSGKHPQHPSDVALSKEFYFASLA